MRPFKQLPGAEPGQTPARRVETVRVGQGAVSGAGASGGGLSGGGSGGGGEDGARLNLLEIFWRRRAVVLCCLAVAVLAAFAYLWNAVPIYRSGAQVYIERTSPQIIGNDMSSLAAGRDLYAQTEIMRSTALLGAALKLPSMQSTHIARESSNPVIALKRSLRVSPSESGDILTVSMDSPIPEDNAIVVNSVVESYLDYHNQKKRSTSAEVLKILREEKRALESEYDRAMRELLDFKQANAELSFSLGQQENVVSSRLSQLSQTLTAAELQTMEDKIRYEAALNVQDEPERLELLLSTAQMDGDPAALAIKSSDAADRIGRMKEYLAELMATHGPAHPRVERQNRRIAELQNLYRDDLGDDPGQKYIKILGSRYRESLAREQALSEEYDRQRALTTQLGAKEAELSMLQSKVRRIDRQVDIIDSRIKELNVTEDAAVMNISILEPASASSTPISPDRPRTFAIAIVMGLMIGLGGAFLLELADDRLRSADEVERLTGLPVMGVVANLGRAKDTALAQVVRDNPRSAITEAFRTIRTAIHFGTAQSAAKVLLITSPTPGDGKSTTASNLAIAFAQSGSRTILIDADCRKPVQHTQWGVEEDATGLSSVLIGDCRASDAIVGTDVPKLELLPCGQLPPHPAELLNSADFVELLRELGETYDRVVIDSPPIGPVTDGRIISAVADATLMVVRAEQTSRRALVAACQAIADVGGRPVGVVINAAPRRRGASYGYRYYGGYGGYGYGEPYGGHVDPDRMLAVNGHAKANGHELQPVRPDGDGRAAEAMDAPDVPDAPGGGAARGTDPEAAASATPDPSQRGEA